MASVVIVVLGAPGCYRELVTFETVDVPAGAPPTGVLAEPGIEAGQWGEWSDAELVLALHESAYLPATEDQTHARLMAFEDGRVLYRVQEGELWQWYIVKLDEEQVEALRRAVARDLADTPSFVCSYATHQTSTILVVRTGPRWRAREVYGLWACFPGAERDAVPVYSQPDRTAPVALPENGFFRAHHRLEELREKHHASAREWHTPKVSLVWSPYVPREGEYAGGPWSESLPSPPSLPKHHSRTNLRLQQPVDGSFGFALQLELPIRGLFDIDGTSWIVEVLREQPGDSTVHCAWMQPWRRCR